MELICEVTLLDFDKNRLLNLFQNVLTSNGYTIMSVSKLDKFYNLKVFKDEREITFSINLSTIKNAFLPKDPTVKRRQIGHLEMCEIKTITKNVISLIIGIAKICDEYVFVCWNPFYFTGHKTNRSCYVTHESLVQMKFNNYYRVKYGNTPSYLFTQSGFELFIDKFIEENGI